MKLNLQKIAFIALALSICQNPIQAQELFKDDSVLNIVLTAPLKQVYRESNKEVRLWMPSHLAYTENDGQTKRIDLAVRTRGVFRRANCKLPPLGLNFKKSEVKDSVFKGQDKLKLVAPCDKTNRSQQQVVLEYLAYKSFEQLTENSLKTRLVRISYIDSDGKLKPWTHLGFIIEHEQKFAKRLDLKPVHVEKIHSSKLDLKATALVELFQLLVANNDYSTIRGPSGKDCCHNIELLAKEGATNNYIPVPYDFDATGLVNARYAMPPESVPIKSVRKRYFTGRCKAVENWTYAIDRMQTERNNILNLFANSKELEPSFKQRNTKFIKEFFTLLDTPNRVDREILGRCRGKK